MRTTTPKRASAAERLGRVVALLLAAGCFGAIAWSARERSEPPSPVPSSVGEKRATFVQPSPAPSAREACLAQKEAEIAAIRAQGELDAERRMRIRQIEARACP
ncbi:MAG: hypothetical protein RMK73_10350 [Geminicoccaceae bacterium]|nr:hypothetical protein [Geminicoccaceae bacterium]MCS7268629.1 hypothetical protein [Geminicoccaceae bacterium]MDW8125358.1 hypothetical protein [Geminicoccaceae bacterium]MDW8341870.1 hypothetical protein [Geminicoccaceae bacterium]